MLIKCPECGLSISDQSNMCVHCGFPLDISKRRTEQAKVEEDYCCIDGNMYNLKGILKMIDDNSGDPIGELMSMTSITRWNAMNLITQIKKNGLPESYESVLFNQPKVVDLEVKTRCPKCGSTSITTGPRGVNFTWGLIGASKTVNRCANCGHTWKPRK